VNKYTRSEDCLGRSICEVNGRDIMIQNLSSAVLTVDQMYAADAAAIDGGISGITLMEEAGAAVARAIIRRWAPRPTIVLCGPGNNGGDGFVIARHLQKAGARDTQVALLGSVDRLKGDARSMAEDWSGEILPLSPAVIKDRALIIDALFGAGLSRDIEGVVHATIEASNHARAVRVAVDIPSGIHGDTGLVLGTHFQGDLTVTFFRKKPGHLLYPGRSACGDIKVVDIGIPESVLTQIAPKISENDPLLWRNIFPSPTSSDHKYLRGHSLVVSGTTGSTGAARLAALAALRVGSGLVTLASPPEALQVNVSHLTTVMTESFEDGDEFERILHSRHRNAVLLGPGNGVTDGTRTRVLNALRNDAACVLDADALTVFSERRAELFGSIRAGCVMTPHDGEFKNLFGEPSPGHGKISIVRDAVHKCGAVLLLKGADTVVAAPDGRIAINSNAPPDLATAGTGDVLSGLIVGLLAQGMEPFEASCAACWIHGELGALAGPGLIAEDLPDFIPRVLRQFER
jgi:hydroxyethylthiazole kinase-like uncharacterized protein yjeF